MLRAAITDSATQIEIMLRTAIIAHATRNRVPLAARRQDSPARSAILWRGVLGGLVIETRVPLGTAQDARGFSPAFNDNGTPRTEGTHLRFEVNNQSYALHFNRDDSRWYLITTEATGRMRAIPVINDDEVGFIPNMVIPIGDGGQASTN